MYNKKYFLVQDTITIYGIEYNYFRNELDKNKNEMIVTPITTKIAENEESMSLTISLSVPEIEILQKIRNCIPISIPYEEFRRTGRYDITLFFPKISLYQELQLLICLDKLGEIYSKFGYYKVLPLISKSDELPDRSKIDELLHNPSTSNETSFFKTVENHLNILFKKCVENERKTLKETQILHYISEIKHSLLVLLKSEFSDEFVISVLYPFSSYLRFVHTYDKKDKIFDFQRDFFYALNMLIQCTMHSERHFIQAPALNISLLDIPPKLLAFYSATAFEITSLLKSEDDYKRDFPFLIVPDFRQGIFVRPIPSEEFEVKESAVYIIYLPEKIFYDPENTLYVMGHEIAHYVGKHDRHREMRSKFIFKSIGYYLLYKTLLLAEEHKNVQSDLFEQLADSFAKLVCETYKKVKKNIEKKYIPDRLYYLTDLEKFFNETKGLILLFFNPTFFDELAKEWTLVLHNKFSKYKGIIKFLLQNLESFDYLENFINNLDERKSVLNLLSKNIIYKIRGSIVHWYDVTISLAQDNIVSDVGTMSLGDQYEMFRQTVFQAFSEAYSDLRMLELFNIKERKIYNQILTKNIPATKQNFQVRLRYNAVCNALDIEKISYSFAENLEIPPIESTDIILRFAENQITQYLKECRKPNLSKSSKNLQNTIEKLHSNNILEFYQIACSKILNYKIYLDSYFKKITDLEDND